MDKEQLIKRASHNGKSAAENDFNRNYGITKTYSDNTIELARSYPSHKQEIYAAHHAAYAEYKRTHRR